MIPLKFDCNGIVVGKPNDVRAVGPERCLGGILFQVVRAENIIYLFKAVGIIPASEAVAGSLKPGREIVKAGCINAEKQ